MRKIPNELRSQKRNASRSLPVACYVACVSLRSAELCFLLTDVASLWLLECGVVMQWEMVKYSILL
jgi:hypothetical protein